MYINRSEPILAPGPLSKTRCGFAAALAALLLAAAAPLWAQVLGSSPAWPQFHGGASSAGVALRDTDRPVRPEWVVDLDGYVFASPVVDRDGTIYIAQRNGHMSALNPDHTSRWHKNFGAPISAPPALATDGSIYFIRHVEAAEDSPFPFHSILTGATTEGDFNWQFELPDDGFTLSAPKVWEGPDGHVVFVYFNRRSAGGPAGELYALDSDGRVLARSGELGCPWPVTGEHVLSDFYDSVATVASFVWKFLTGPGIEFDPGGIPGPLDRPLDPTPALLDTSNMVDSGVLVAIADNLCNIGVFHYDDGELQERWKVLHELEQLHGSPMMIPAGLLVIGNEAGKVSGFDPLEGNRLWQYQAGEPVLTTPASFTTPIYVVGAQHLHVLASDGDKIEKLGLSGSRFASPVASNNWLHIAEEGDLLSLERTNLHHRAHHQDYSPGMFEPAPAIGPEGRLYVIHEGSQLWAYPAP